jgi:microcystin-dependent protein
VSEAYLGEIRMFAGNFAPVDWHFCDGTMLAISENDALFSLLGTTYGGDGQTTFALPDLRGRLPLHPGPGFTLGQLGGAESVTLTLNQIPVHSHALLSTSDAASTADPVNAVAAVQTTAGAFPYGTDIPKTNLAPNALSSFGGSQPHDNFQPYLCVSFIIALAGIYPPQP